MLNVCSYENDSFLLNQLHAWFLKIKITFMWMCVCFVCVRPQATYEKLFNCNEA